MKTTLVLDDALVDRVRKRAKERGVSMSSIVEEAILQMLMQETPDHPPLELPSFNSGGYLVDISDRNALYDSMDEM
jgi:hypothetical protein